MALIVKRRNYGYGNFGADADYTTFFSNQGKYTFEVQDSKAVLDSITILNDNLYKQWITSHYHRIVIATGVDRS